MAEYLLYLDESNTTPENPYFCLAGFIIERKEYENVLVPKVNKCKDILGDSHIIFHYVDMKKSKGQFKMLKNGEVRKKFWNELKNVLNTTNLYTIGACLNKTFYIDNFPKEFCKESYLITMQKIITNYIHFLHKNNSTGSIICESRNFKDDMMAQQSYVNITNNGTNIFVNEMINKHLATISFNIKKDNYIGLQIADIIPLSFIRNLHGKSDHYNLYQILSSKLYDGDVNKSDVFGFTKIFE